MNLWTSLLIWVEIILACVLSAHIQIKFVSGGSHYEGTVLCQTSLCRQHQRADPGWHSHTFLYISKRSQSQTHSTQPHRDLSSAEMLLMMDCCGFRKRGKNKAVTQQAVTHASPVNSSSTCLAALKRPYYCSELWWLLDICDAKKRITFGKWAVQLMLKLMPIN